MPSASSAANICFSAASLGTGRTPTKVMPALKDLKSVRPSRRDVYVLRRLQARVVRGRCTDGSVQADTRLLVQHSEPGKLRQDVEARPLHVLQRELRLESQARACFRAAPGPSPRP